MQIPSLKSRKFLSQRHRLSSQQIDDLLLEENSAEYISEKYAQLFQVKEFINITDEFREAHINFTPLKGPLLSYKLHEDLSYRYSNDLDFLVDPGSIKKVILILKEKGYRSHYFSWPSGSLKERFLLNLSNQILFYHPDKQINIEIHWKLFKPVLTNPNNLSSLIASNTEIYQLKNRNFDTLSNELELLYLVIHGGLHSWFRLKWLLDVKNYIEKRSIDTEKFIELTDKLKAQRMVFLCNSVLAKYFPTCPALPYRKVTENQRILEFALKQIQDEDYYDKNFYERVRTYWYELNCFPGFRYKLSMIAVIFYGKYLKTFEFNNSSYQN